MVNNILIEVLGTIAEQERITTRQRQTEGIAAARKRGVKFGRKPIPLPPNWDEVITIWENGEITAREAMRRTGVGHATFYRLVSITKKRESVQENKRK
jgi:Site-specific recombinases, DNA invertase Pin homologs